MELPNFQFFFNPILKLLADGRQRTRRDVLREALESGHFTEEQLALEHSGGNRVLVGRAGWALAYLKQAGLVDSPKRSMFAISKEGLRVHRSGVMVNRAYLMQFKGFREFLERCNRGRKVDPQEVETVPVAPSDNTPEDNISAACEELNAALRSELISEVLKMKETEFERFCVRLLVKMGYGSMKRSKATKASGDGGIDGVVTLDRLGFDKIYIQAKLYSTDSTVPESMVRDFIGAIDNEASSGRGAFITTSRFSKGAIAKAQGSKHHEIMLIDGEKLSSLMLEFDFGVQTKDTYVVKELNPTFFEDYELKE